LLLLSACVLRRKEIHLLDSNCVSEPKIQHWGSG
jgi:hypothetical protein